MNPFSTWDQKARRGSKDPSLTTISKTKSGLFKGTTSRQSDKENVEPQTPEVVDHQSMGTSDDRRKSRAFSLFSRVPFGSSRLSNAFGVKISGFSSGNSSSSSQAVDSRSESSEEFDRPQTVVQPSPVPGPLPQRNDAANISLRRKRLMSLQSLGSLLPTKQDDRNAGRSTLKGMVGGTKPSLRQKTSRPDLSTRSVKDDPFCAMAPTRRNYLVRGDIGVDLAPSTSSVKSTDLPILPPVPPLPQARPLSRDYKSSYLPIQLRPDSSIPLESSSRHLRRTSFIVRADPWNVPLPPWSEEDSSELLEKDHTMASLAAEASNPSAESDSLSYKESSQGSCKTSFESRRSLGSADQAPERSGFVVTDDKDDERPRSSIVGLFGGKASNGDQRSISSASIGPNSKTSTLSTNRKDGGILRPRSGTAAAVDPLQTVRARRPQRSMNSLTGPRTPRRVSPSPKRPLPPVPAVDPEVALEDRVRELQAFKFLQVDPFGTGEQAMSTSTSRSTLYRTSEAEVNTSSSQRGADVSDIEEKLRFYAMVGARQLYFATAQSARAQGL
ncbi:hypothetical protein FRB90_006773 [Tulasnella sp. 427]|nr:hypothetical protein FRB90_006773 [Tulasnella sp. 427]